MSDIIDLNEFKKRLLETAIVTPGADEAEKADIENIINGVADKYIDWAKTMDHSFQLQCTPEQGRLTQEKIDAVRRDYSYKIIELIGELAEKQVRLYMLEKYR